MQLRKIIKAVYFIDISIICLFVKYLQQVLGYKKERIWLICEQPNMARDNGIAFYNYCMRRKLKGIKIYYLLDFNSPDYEEIYYKDNLINYGSFKHFLYLFKAEVHIMAFKDAIFPSEIVGKIFRKLRLVNGQRVYLKHGIIKDDIKMYHSDNFDINLFITAAEDEYKFILDKYGFDSTVVKLLGLCRFDLLNNELDKEKIKIIIMPTWRRWIKEGFEDSEFYNKYCELIKELTEIYKDKLNISCYFYLHNNFQRYASVFKDTQVVKIITSKEYKVNALIKECNLMITDYSSVAFDFAYLNKPIIYYQFDYGKVRREHYESGYFSYENHGFGPVSYNIEELKEQIIEIENNNFNVTKLYAKRSEKFFMYRDKSNCERTYNEILKICNERV